MPTTEYGVDQFFQNAGTSPKMVYDASGVLGWSPHNLLPQSKDSSVVGAIFNVTFTVDVTAGPLGDVTADQIAFIGGNTGYYYRETLGTNVAGATYCGSVWLKAAAPVSIGFRTTSADGSGTPGVVLANVTTAWQRFSTFCVAGSTIAINVGLDHRSGVTGDDGLAKTVIAADWQINRGTVPTAYLPTTTAARVGLALDYDPVTHAARGLLCEPQATNLQPNSHDVPLNVENGTVTSNNQTGPEGTLTADTFTENTATGLHGAYGSQSVTANTDYTVSHFKKMGTRRYGTIGWSDGTNGAYAVYDLQSGVVGSSAAIGTGVLNSASIQSVGNGWYRCILSAKMSTTTGYYTFYAANAATITADSFGRQSFLGTSATLIYGPGQVEAGTVATSLIPTLAATVTRAGDQVNITPASINYSATAGSWWADVDLIAQGPAGERLIGQQAIGAAIFAYWGASAFGVYDVAVLAGPLSTLTNPSKVAVAFANSDRAITVNGLAPSTDTSAGSMVLTPGTLIGIGCNGSGGDQINGYIRKVRYLPRRPTNAELQTMTT